jgi:hypothetical protein
MGEAPIGGLIVGLVPFGLPLNQRGPQDFVKTQVAGKKGDSSGDACSWSSWSGAFCTLRLPSNLPAWIRRVVSQARGWTAAGMAGIHGPNGQRQPA